LAAIGINSNNPAFWIGVVIGSLVVGTACGSLPFFLAKSRNRLPLGTAALVSCIVSGAILGLLLALPVAIIFTIIILVMGSQREAPGFPAIMSAPPPPVDAFPIAPQTDPAPGTLPAAPSQSNLPL
jgi:hypothetical protein